MSALPPKADMCGATRYVRFVPDLGHRGPYSNTSSARPISVLGMVRPSVLAVFRLMYSSTFVACCTGRSAGFSPLNSAGIVAGQAVSVRKVRSVAQQTSGRSELTKLGNRWHGVTNRQRGELCSLAGEE